MVTDRCVVFVMQRCLLSQSSFAICSGEFVTKIFNFKLFSFCLMVSRKKAPRFVAENMFCFDGV